MQTLEMSSERRARLLADSQLAINSRNEEILHGLTHEESQFLIDFDEAAPADVAALERRGELTLRHEQARLRIAVADDEGSADEEYRLRVETRF